jgi:hypothetical protein
MRIKLAVAAAAAVTVVGGTGAAAYAVVGHSTVSPTVAGNDLPIDDNHSPVPTSRSAEPGDDRGRDGAPASGATAEPGDDHGAAVEPGDDRGRGRGTDDVTPEPGDDHGGRGSAIPTTTAAPVPTPDRSGGSGGSGPGGDDGSGGGGSSGRGGADDGGGHR